MGDRDQCNGTGNVVKDIKEYMEVAAIKRDASSEEKFFLWLFTTGPMM